jgi:hypothetical protein
VDGAEGPALLKRGTRKKKITEVVEIVTLYLFLYFDELGIMYCYFLCEGAGLSFLSQCYRTILESY